MTDIPHPNDSPGHSQASRFKELESLFERVAGVPSDEQNALLKELCADRDMRKQVRALLNADSSNDQLLDHSLVPEQISPGIGEQIDGYKLVRELAQGGMGVVFMAEQFKPVRRKVALKVIKPGVDTREVIARFDAERQALSLMDHPNIAKVLDAGSTEAGRPYFVMELVNGQPITTYCDKKQLSVQERLELFLPVCRAIQHAHQKGIIHRDIKPSNVLVAEYDGRPVAKVIDFGIAKAINESLTDMTVNTGFGQIIGTYDYMSPEQSRINQLDVDTRSDIYSLGVLLYELLTGTPPFDKERLRSVDRDEMLRIIREEDPPKPSTRLAERVSRKTATNQLSTRTDPDRNEPATPRRSVPGELDWIVMKALEKDRNRRYGTPNGLANDIDRFLSGDAVAACPPSPAYLFSKFAKRNKAALATSTIVATTLILGLIATTNQAIRAQRAEKATAISEEETEAVNSFVLDDVLGLASPESQLAAGLQPDPNLKLIAMLNRAATQVDTRFSNRPHAQARMKATLADSYNGLGYYEAALPFYNEQLAYLTKHRGREHEDTIRVMQLLTRVYINLSRLGDAERLCNEALQSSRRNESLGPKHSVTLLLRSDLATLYQKQKLYKKAENEYTDLLKIRSDKLGDGHPDTLSTMSHLAILYEKRDRFGEAKDLHERVLGVYELKVPLDELRIATSLNNLGRCYLKRGRFFDDPKQFVAATPHLERGAKIFQQQRGPDHPDSLAIQGNLAQAYCEQRRYDDAAPILEDLADRLIRLRTTEDATTIDTINALGWTYAQQGRFAEAEHILSDLHDTLKNSQRYGPSDARTLQVRGNLSNAYYGLVKLDQSMQLDQTTLALPTNVLGENDFERLSSMARLGLSYLEKEAPSEVDIGKGRKLLENVFNADPNLPRALKIATELAASYRQEGDSTNALLWMDRRIANAKNNFPSDSLQLANVLSVSGARLLRMQSWSKAEKALRQCYKIRQTRIPESWLTFNTQSMLGEALSAQDKHDEAEPILLKAYLGLKQLKTQSATTPPAVSLRLAKALDRLITHYRTTDNKDEIKKWRKEKRGAHEAPLQ